MKKNILKIAILLFLSVVSGSVFGQNAYTPKERLVLEQALTTLENYETLCTLSDDDAYYSFLDLFDDEETKIYNDLLGLSFSESISAKEYADKLRQTAKATKVYVKNINRDRIWEEDGRWKVQYSFDKLQSYTNECGAYFSTEEFYKSVYKMQMVLVYSDKSETCRIESITGSIDSNSHLPENFYTFQRTSAKDDYLKYKGSTLKFNSYDQAFIEGPVTKNQFQYSDADVTASPTINEECHQVKVDYKTRRLRLGIHYDMGLGNAYSVDTEDGVDVTSSCNEFGLDFGYTFPSKTKIKTSLNFGLMLSQSKIDLTTGTMDYSYSANSDADADGDSYTRYYQNMQASEQVKMTNLGIPLYADFDFCFNPYVSVYLQAGVKAYMKMSAKLNNYQLSGYVYGIYSQYDNLRMDEHWGNNGFGNIAMSVDNLANSDVPVKSFSMDGFGGLGLRIKPLRSIPLALNIGMQYQMGLIGMWDADPTGLSLNGSLGSASSKAISSYTVQGGEKAKMLNNSISSMKRQGMKLNIGLIFKF